MLVNVRNEFVEFYHFTCKQGGHTGFFQPSANLRCATFLTCEIYEAGALTALRNT